MAHTSTLQKDTSVCNSKVESVAHTHVSLYMIHVTCEIYHTKFYISFNNYWGVQSKVDVLMFYYRDYNMYNVKHMSYNRSARS